jgi:hypothetical protein
MKIEGQISRPSFFDYADRRFFNFFFLSDDKRKPQKHDRDGRLEKRICPAG